MYKPTVLAITGLSTAGKTYIAQALPQFTFYPMVSVTTRPMRPGELNDFDYKFVSTDHFDCLSVNGQLVEEISFAGYRYGLERNHFHDALHSGLIAAHVCTPDGVEALNILSNSMQFNLVSIWVDAPDLTVIYRMCKRWLIDQNMDKGYLIKRLALALTTERSWTGSYNYIIGNSDALIPVVKDVIERHNSGIFPPLQPLTPLAVRGYTALYQRLYDLFTNFEPPRNTDMLNDMVSSVVVEIFH